MRQNDNDNQTNQSTEQSSIRTSKVLLQDPSKLLVLESEAEKNSELVMAI